jgi:hypothetical protein
MARHQPPHRRRPGAPCLDDCWIGRSLIVQPTYWKFVWRSPRQVVWRRRFTRFMYWRWHLGSWVPRRLFRRRLRWIAGCRRLYLRRFDRRRGHFRYCCDWCRRVRMSHVAQRTAGLSVPAQLCAVQNQGTLLPPEPGPSCSPDGRASTNRSKKTPGDRLCTARSNPHVSSSVAESQRPALSCARPPGREGRISAAQAKRNRRYAKWRARQKPS